MMRVGLQINETLTHSLPPWINTKSSGDSNPGRETGGRGNSYTVGLSTEKERENRCSGLGKPLARARYSPEEYLAVIGDAVDETGFRRMDLAGGDMIAELSMTRPLVFLETGDSGTGSKECDWSEREGNGCC